VRDNVVRGERELKKGAFNGVVLGTMGFFDRANKGLFVNGQGNSRVTKSKNKGDVIGRKDCLPLLLATGHESASWLLSFFTNHVGVIMAASWKCLGQLKMTEENQLQ